MNWVIMFLISLIQNNTPIRMGIDVSGLDVSEINWYVNEGGSISVLFAKSVAPINPYQGMYLWAAADDRLQELINLSGLKDIEIIVEESYTPGWVTGWYTNNGNYMPGEPNERPVDETYNGFYADKFEAMVLRWKPGGINDRGISSWGLWNEPDGAGLMMGSQEYSDTYDPTLGYIAYRNIGSLCAERIKESDASATIISGGFSNMRSCRPGDDWEPGAREMIQTIFSTGLSPGPVPCIWQVIPNMLHWHPYDWMKLDLPDTPEWHYDPLVIDTDDLMFIERPEEIGALMDNEWLLMPSQYYWQKAPQYSLEHYPIYSLDYWRENYTPSTVPADSFYSDWRANYFVTGNLLLTQSNRMTTIAPVVPIGNWWVEGWNGGWSPVNSGDTWRNGDKAYRTQTRFINGCTVEDYGVIQIPSTEMKVYRWLYNPPAESEMVYTTVHALRTFRNNPEVGSYNPDEAIIISLDVSNTTDFVRVWDMLGEGYVDYDNIQHGSVEIPVTGYMQYALEYPAEISTNHSSSNIMLSVSRPEEGSLMFTSNRNVIDIIVYDISGRQVWNSRNDSTNYNQNDGNIFLWQYSRADTPSGCYLVIGCNPAGNIIARRKVVIQCPA